MSKKMRKRQCLPIVKGPVLVENRMLAIIRLVIANVDHRISFPQSLEIFTTLDNFICGQFNFPRRFLFLNYKVLFPYDFNVFLT